MLIYLHLVRFWKYGTYGTEISSPNFCQRCKHMKYFLDLNIMSLGGDKDLKAFDF